MTYRTCITWKIRTIWYKLAQLHRNMINIVVIYSSVLISNIFNVNFQVRARWVEKGYSDCGPGYRRFLLDRFTLCDGSAAQERAETGTTFSICWKISLALKAWNNVHALRQEGRCFWWTPLPERLESVSTGGRGFVRKETGGCFDTVTLSDCVCENIGLQWLLTVYHSADTICQLTSM